MMMMILRFADENAITFKKNYIPLLPLLSPTLPPPLTGGGVRMAREGGRRNRKRGNRCYN